MSNATREAASTSGSRRPWCGWIFTGSLVAYAAAVHHGLGRPPGGSAQHWYEPTGWLYLSGPLSFAFESGTRVLVSFTLPAVLLAAGVFTTGRSAIARGIALSCVTASLLFAFYGEFAPRPWEFFGWRGSAALWLTAVCVGFSAAAPFLAASWLRLGWPLRIALYAPVALAAVASICNTTGTNPKLRYSISPWPAVPVFGLETAAVFVLALLGGLAVACFSSFAADTRRDAVRRIGAVCLGLLTPLALLGLGSWLGMFPFRLDPRTLIAVTAICGLGIAAVLEIRVAGDREVLWRRARSIAVGSALIAAPIFTGQVLARLDYYVVREVQARSIIQALDAYAERESLFPDSLDELVAAGDIATIPAPSIGFVGDAAFRYQSFGSSFILEFDAPRWVQCAYTPPFEDDEDGAEAGESLGEAWSCPSEPPELW